MDAKLLNEILEAHKKWIRSEEGGKRADLRDADLRDAYLWNADLSGADLRNAYLRDADLRDADLSGADLRNAYLRDADLSGAYLWDADLRDADLRNADLRDADLRNADLRDAKDVFFPLACPTHGSFIAWKKALTQDGSPLIVKLLIPEDAKRLSASGHKCRADKAEVLEVQTLDGEEYSGDAVSAYNTHFIYKVGKTVTPENVFCEDRWQECSSGIHFFVNREEAVRHKV